MSKKVTELDIHEAKDRISVNIENLSNSLEKHKGLKHNKKAYKLYKQSVVLLHNAYLELFNN